MKDRMTKKKSDKNGDAVDFCCCFGFCLQHSTHSVGIFLTIILNDLSNREVHNSLIAESYTCENMRYLSIVYSMYIYIFFLTLGSYRRLEMLRRFF